jgi:hypothetical protein
LYFTAEGLFKKISVPNEIGPGCFPFVHHSF